MPAMCARKRDMAALAADLNAVSLLDVHRAVGGPRIFAIGNENPNPTAPSRRW